jgi:carbon-monoxide dehydrogenase medium subunit
MKFPDFRYARPETVAEALDLLATEGEAAQILAGGQTLMPLLAMRLAEPGILIDLGRIESLRGVELEDGEVRIGAMTRYVDLERSPLVAEHAPLVAKALPHVAHVAIRNRGTLGGSIALGDPAAEMPAVVLAMGGRIELTSRDRRRWVPAELFWQGLYQTMREEDEIVTAIVLPSRSGQRAGFAEVARRHGDYAMAGAAAVGQVDGGRVEGLRVAMFGVDDQPVLAERAASIVEAEGWSDFWLREAVGALEDDIAPTDTPLVDAGTRRRQAGAVFRRAILDLAGEREGGGDV